MLLELSEKSEKKKKKKKKPDVNFKKDQIWTNGLYTVLMTFLPEAVDVTYSLFE